jgi:hypothetical protein
VIGVLLLALAAVGPPAPAEVRRQTLFVAWDATTKACVPKVNGVETGDIESETGKAALIAALPDKGATLSLIGTAAIPYRCTDAIVSTLRTAGYYGRIGFNAQPAPPVTR